MCYIKLDVGCKAGVRQEMHKTCDRDHWEYTEKIRQGRGAARGERNEKPVDKRHSIILGAVDKNVLDRGST